MSYCPRSSLPTNVLAWPASRLAHQAPSRPPGRGGTPPLALEVRLDAVAAVLMDGLSSRRAARMVGICKTEVGDSLDLGRAGPSFSAPTIARVAALMLDKNPRSATDIPPASVTVTHRTGDPLLECWEVTVVGHPECTTQEATGRGWVFVDDTLAAA